MKKNILLIILTLIFLNSCEDLPPDVYFPRTFVEGYLIVDEPINGIIVMRSMPVLDSFNYRQSLITDANVQITELSGDNGNLKYQLIFRDEPNQGYYYPDTTLKVKPKTKYRLEITLKTGEIITGETTTPERMQWKIPPRDTLYYPKDTINLPSPDSLKISWQPAPNIFFHLIRIRCLDTLNYGKYLNPPTDELNRRITRPWERNVRFYNDVTRWVGPLPASESPVVWTALKWYGLNEITIYAPDYNFLRWFIHNQRRSQYEPLLSSVDGAMGVFGSASSIKKVAFIVKNQP